MNNTQQPTVRIAASPINWHNDDFPILGHGTSAETILSEMQQAGFHGTELGSFFPADADDLRKLLDRHNLELAAGWHSAYLLTRKFDDESKRFKKQVDFLAGLGAKHVTIAECSHCPFKPYSGNPSDQHYAALKTPLFPNRLPKLSPQQWRDLGKNFTALQKIATDSGLTLGYHPHIQTVVENEQQLEKLVNEAPELGLTIDTGHMRLSGADPVAIVKKYIGKIKHMHVKNVRENVADAARDGNMGFEFAVIEGVFTVPGDGGIDFPAIFQLLKEHHYSGWLVVEAEQNPGTANPYLYAALGREYIKQVSGW